MAVARKPRPVWLLIAVILALTIAGVLTAKHVYERDIQPVSSSQQTQIFTVDKGSSVKQIAVKLEKEHLIKSAWAFQVYVHRSDLTAKLQAGTYALSPSESVKQIASILSGGRTTVQLVTILPGRRIDQVRADLINSGFAPNAVDAALNPAQYKDLPVMALAPAGVNTLEGLLWPDSWQKDATTGPDYIIRQSLTAMGDHLTPDLQAAFSAEGLTTYQGLTLASIVVQEVNRPADQAQAAQVFLSRLRAGSMLGSDVTARYGAIVAGKSPNDLSFDSPYNTRLHTGLPPTPISSVNQTSLAAAAHPASTNWLYFVTGDDGVTHFSTNLQDHQALTKQYCHKLCGN
jgi:UPF0755 protein